MLTFFDNSCCQYLLIALKMCSVIIFRHLSLCASTAVCRHNKSVVFIVPVI